MNNACEEENIRERRFVVDPNFENWRLDQFLSERIKRMSRTLASDVIRRGNVQILPERRVKAGMRLHNNDIVILKEYLEPEVVQDDDVQILYRDDSLLVINKPAGMLVHESVSIRLNTITHYLMRQGFADAEPAHRLDRDTSGALLCAATKDTIAPLRLMFATDHPEKVYRALVLDPDYRWEVGHKCTLDTPLGLDESSSLGLKMGRGELHAITHVEVLARRDHPMSPMADLKVTIETGRQHQIRIHLAMQGTPIAADKLYSVNDEFFKAISDNPDDPKLCAQLPFQRQALHAWQIKFAHPITGEMLAIEAPLPGIWGGVC